MALLRKFTEGIVLAGSLTVLPLFLSGTLLTLAGDSQAIRFITGGAFFFVVSAAVIFVAMAHTST